MIYSWETCQTIIFSPFGGNVWSSYLLRVSRYNCVYTVHARLCEAFIHVRSERDTEVIASIQLPNRMPFGGIHVCGSLAAGSGGSQIKGIGLSPVDSYS